MMRQSSCSSISNCHACVTKGRRITDKSVFAFAALLPFLYFLAKLLQVLELGVKSHACYCWRILKARLTRRDCDFHSYILNSKVSFHLHHVCEIETKWIQHIRTDQARTILIGLIFLLFLCTGGFAPNCCKTPEVIVGPRSSFTRWARATMSAATHVHLRGQSIPLSESEPECESSVMCRWC